MTTRYATSREQSADAGGDWLKLSSELTRSTDLIAGRRDLLVTITPGAGHGSKACFSPGKRWIEINGEVTEAELQPRAWNESATPVREVVPHTRWSDRDKIPVTWGLLTHECAHAAHTRWPAKLDLKALAADADERAAFEAAKLLEEPRIEFKQSWRRWWDTRWLRMSASRLLLEDVSPEGASSRQVAARTLTLIQGRVLAGILSKNEAAQAVEQARQILKNDAGDLEHVINKALDVRDTDAETMMELGREWVRIVGEPPVPDASADGEGDESGGGIAAQLAQAILDAVGAMGSQIQVEKGWPGGTLEGWMGDASFVPDWIDATGRQKTKAALLARRLRDWSIPERSSTMLARREPPGRLMVREAIRGDALEAAGQIPDIEPWRRTDRRVVQTPPLRAGIVVDSSGSMSDLAGHSRELAYRLSTAFASVPDARVRTVLAGRGIAPWQSRPGQIPVYDYGHGTQDVHLAIDDLAEHLALYRRGNGRLLIVISDGCLHGQQIEGTERRLRNLVKAGCRVLWLDFAGSHSFASLKDRYPGVQVVVLEGDPEEAADVAEVALEKILLGLKP